MRKRMKILIGVLIVVLLAGVGYYFSVGELFQGRLRMIRTSPTKEIAVTKEIAPVVPSIGPSGVSVAPSVKEPECYNPGRILYNSQQGTSNAVYSSFDDFKNSLIAQENSGYKCPFRVEMDTPHITDGLGNSVDGIVVDKSGTGSAGKKYNCTIKDSDLNIYSGYIVCRSIKNGSLIGGVELFPVYNVGHSWAAEYNYNGNKINYANVLIRAGSENDTN